MSKPEYLSEDFLGKLKQAAQRLSLARYTGRGISEQDTKNAFIEPILEQIGWPKHDLECVRAEYRAEQSPDPVDYALLHNDTPILFIEAKALDLRIDEPKVIQQLFKYATMAGVEWGLLTNGRRWDLYALFLRGRAEERRFFSIDLLESPQDAVVLAWLTHQSLVSGALEAQRRAWFATSQLRAELLRSLPNLQSDLLARFQSQAGLTPQDLEAALVELRPILAPPDPLPWLIRALRSPPPAQQAQEQAQEQASPLTDRLALPSSDRAYGLPDPPPGVRPAAFGVEDQTWPVKAWRDLPVTLLRWLHTYDPVRYEMILDLPQWSGRKRRYISRDTSQMHSPAPIPHGFVEVNLSGEWHVRLTRQVLEAAALSSDLAWYQINQRRVI